MVGDGLGLSCLQDHCDGLAGGDLTLRAAFAASWPGWACAHRFPLIRATLHRSDLPRILTNFDERKVAGMTVWSGRTVKRAELRSPSGQPALTVDDAWIAVTRSSGVPMRSWLALTRALHRALQDQPALIVPVDERSGPTRRHRQIDR